MNCPSRREARPYTMGLTQRNSAVTPLAARTDDGANAGDADRAIDLLEELSETAYQLGGATSWFRLEARWDPLREAPRFQALIED